MHQTRKIHAKNGKQAKIIDWFNGAINPFTAHEGVAATGFSIGSVGQLLTVLTKRGYAVSEIRTPTEDDPSRRYYTRNAIAPHRLAGYTYGDKAVAPVTTAVEAKEKAPKPETLAAVHSRYRVIMLQVLLRLENGEKECYDKNWTQDITDNLEHFGIKQTKFRGVQPVTEDNCYSEPRLKD